jgi:hypothetical protein
MQQRRLIGALLCAAWCSASAAAETSALGMAVRVDATLQAGRQQTRYFDALRGVQSAVDSIEARINMHGQCVEKWCDGASFVLRPRLYTASEREVPAGLSGRPSSLPEAYLLQSAGESMQFGLGKRLLGWGPALLYSPSNRLFPDNGAVSPRKELAGKPMVFASASLPLAGRGMLIVADPREQDFSGSRIGGTFFAARGEWQQQDDKTSTLGVVAAGGGALAPYLGLYAQRGLTDALTLGFEMAMARKYAGSTSESQLSQNRGGMKSDMVANLRYGLSSGGEIGLELIQNGYAMSDSELGNPLLAALPSAGSNPSWNRPLHPLVQRRYALIQVITPSLFGNKRWGLTARVLRGLDKPSTDSFAELSWSVTDATTLYAGYSQSRVPPSLQMTRPVTHSSYLTLESFF